MCNACICCATSTIPAALQTVPVLTGLPLDQTPCPPLRPPPTSAQLLRAEMALAYKTGDRARAEKIYNRLLPDDQKK